MFLFNPFAKSPFLVPSIIQAQGVGVLAIGLVCYVSTIHLCVVRTLSLPVPSAIRWCSLLKFTRMAIGFALEAVWG